MLSAGNDIVALSEVDVARTITKQFYSKILYASEIAHYDQLSGEVLFEHYVWLLWSIKESAYKFLKRIDTELVFTPVKFEIQQLEIPAEYSMVSFDRREDASILTGLIQIGNYRLYSKSMIYEELISSVVDNDEHFDGVYNDIKHITSTKNAVQSAEVRTFFIEELDKLTSRSDIILQKNKAGIPVLFQGQEELPIAVSLSHHGNYIAYSFKMK